MEKSGNSRQGNEKSFESEINSLIKKLNEGLRKIDLITILENTYISLKKGHEVYIVLSSELLESYFISKKQNGKEKKLPRFVYKVVALNNKGGSKTFKISIDGNTGYDSGIYIKSFQEEMDIMYLTEKEWRGNIIIFEGEKVIKIYENNDL